jgi:hypothetical protein
MNRGGAQGGGAELPVIPVRGEATSSPAGGSCFAESFRGLGIGLRFNLGVRCTVIAKNFRKLHE